MLPAPGILRGAVSKRKRKLPGQSRAESGTGSVTATVFYWSKQALNPPPPRFRNMDKPDKGVRGETPPEEGIWEEMDSVAVFGEHDLLQR